MRRCEDRGEAHTISGTPYPHSALKFLRSGVAILRHSYVSFPLVRRTHAPSTQTITASQGQRLSFRRSNEVSIMNAAFADVQQPMKSLFVAARVAESLTPIYDNEVSY